MISETEIILLLLQEIKDQLVICDDTEYSLPYCHPRIGELIFKLKTRVIHSLDFEKGTLALDFSVNHCICSLTAGKKETILKEIEKYLEGPEPIVKEIPNYYRMIFDYP